MQIKKKCTANGLRTLLNSMTLKVDLNQHLLTQNNNNNNNNHDDISAIIIAEPLRELTRFTQ